MEVKAPWVIMWLEWNLYAYWPSLVMSIIAVCAHKVYYMQEYNIIHSNLSDVSLVLFVGMSAWIVYCAFRYGYAVG